MNPTKVLLVEGRTDKRVIPELMEKRGVVWEVNKEGRKEYVAKIETADGLIQKSALSAQLKATGLKSLGVVFDADVTDSGTDRWAQMADICKKLRIEFPERPSSDGLITESSNGVRLGFWMMPNNLSPGMLETFLSGLIGGNKSNNTLFEHAKKATEEAKKLGAPYKDVHLDKARIHAWLAWQDEPGAQLHEAIQWGFLNPDSSNADAFVFWFRKLFDV